mgnify:FL=1
MDEDTDSDECDDTFDFNSDILDLKREDIEYIIEQVDSDIVEKYGMTEDGFENFLKYL